MASPRNEAVATKSEAASQATAILELLESLGFTINFEKSILDPTQRLEFLGFIIDSTNMSIDLPHEKRTKIRVMCKKLVQKTTVSVREIAQLVGVLEAARPAISLAPLHYRHLQQLQVCARLKDILAFLADQFRIGKQYRTINVLRSAISSVHPHIDGHLIGQHPYVCQLLRGVAVKRPPQPRYSSTWDVR